MLWPLLLVLVLVAAVFHKWRLRHLNRMWKQLPSGIKTIPLIGHAHMFFGNHEVRMQTLLKFGRDALNHEGMSRMQVGPAVMMVVLADPILIETAAKHCLDKADFLKFARFFTGNGSVFAPTQIWRPRRKILAPIFSAKNLNRFVKVFSRQSQYMAEMMKQRIRDGTIYMWQYATTYAMDSIFETNLGVNVEAQKNPNHSFLVNFDMGVQVVAKRIFEPWIHPEIIFKLLPIYQKAKIVRKAIHTFIESIIRQKRIEVKDRCEKSITEDVNKDKPFLELLLESPSNMSDVELREEMLVIALAGTDTSAVGLAFTILMLSRYPEMQEKAYEELYSIFGDSDRNVNPEDLPKLQYLDCFIRETLRLYPPVPFIAREVTKAVQLPNGVMLAEGASVMFHLWATMRHPKYWGDDAEEFRPERFLDPLKHPVQFAAFSTGPRNCLGYQYAMMSMKTSVANVLRKFKILLPPEDNNNSPNKKPVEIKLKWDIMMKDAGNFKVFIEERKSSR